MKKNIVRPIVKYHGGKYYLCDWIISQFPEHRVYVEPFGGSASVLLNKPASNIEVYNDLEPTMYNLMNVVKLHCGAFLNLVFCVKYSKDIYFEFRDIYRSKEKFAQLDSLNQAAVTYIVRRMSRGGVCGTFSWSKRVAKNGVPAEEYAWLTMQNEIPKISNRLTNVEMRNQDAISLIKEFDSPDTLMYLDPPYPKSTRVSPTIYIKEMDDHQHIQLGEILQTVKSKIIISSYPSVLYEKLFSGWRVIERKIPNHSSHQKQKEFMTEKLWLNF